MAERLGLWIQDTTVWGSIPTASWGRNVTQTSHVKALFT